MQGQWKQISRYYVPSRTPTQVASHAQKHFLRLGGGTKRRSRFAALDHIAATPCADQMLPPGAQPAVPAHSAPRPPAAPLGNALTQAHQQGAPPPVSADGMALGIPVPRHAPLLPRSQQPPARAGSSGTLPMLRVLPGRISATVTYVEAKPRSPAPSQEPAAPRRPQRYSRSARRAQLEQLRDLGEQLRSERDNERGTPGPGSASMAVSVGSDGSNASHAALDALAGVAAALADSAAIF